MARAREVDPVLNRDYERQWYAQNADREREKRRVRYGERREAHLAYMADWNTANWMRRHHITPDDYAQLLASQHGVCAVCGGINENGKHLEVDHDHSCCPGLNSCGRCVRGLLCGPCNRALGHVNDDPARLRALAAYVETTAEENPNGNQE